MADRKGLAAMIQLARRQAPVRSIAPPVVGAPSAPATPAAAATGLAPSAPPAPAAPRPIAPVAARPTAAARPAPVAAPAPRPVSRPSPQPPRPISLPTTPRPVATSDDDVDEVKELAIGSVALAFGLLFSLGMYFSADASASGRQYRILGAAILVGLYYLGRGIYYCFKNGRPSPWRAIAGSLVLPIVTVWGMSAYSGAGLPATDPNAARRKEAERIGKERAIRAQQAAEAARKAEDTARAERQAQNLANSLAVLLQADRPAMQCDAARALGNSDSRDAVEPLADQMHGAASDPVRACAASALLKLGEVDRVLPVFTQWAGETGDRQRLGLMGFGEIGEPAAEVAMPFLLDGLKSPNQNVKAVTIQTLGQIGPSGEPWLKGLLNAPEPWVRSLVKQSLAQSR